MRPVVLNSNFTSQSIQIKIRELLYHLTEMENNLEKWKGSARNEMLTKLIQ
jgi:hypothetical protein